MEKLDSLSVWSGRLNSGLLDSGLLDSGRQDTWTLDDWTLGLWTTGRLNSGLLDAWTLDDWTLGPWTLGARKFFPFLVTSISFLLLVNVKFLIISSTLQLIYYGSAECAANDCYNSTYSWQKFSGLS